MGPKGGGLWDDGHHENHNTIVTWDDDILENTTDVFIMAPVNHRDKTKDTHRANEKTMNSKKIKKDHKKGYITTSWLRSENPFLDLKCKQ